jgi:hypothetical protein
MVKGTKGKEQPDWVGVLRVVQRTILQYYDGTRCRMIELTEAQRRELTATEVPQFLDPETGKTYVLLPIEAYKRLRNVLEDEPRVTGEMVDRLMEEEDRDDPALDCYQQPCGRKS